VGDSGLNVSGYAQQKVIAFNATAIKITEIISVFLFLVSIQLTASDFISM
jgi:hypothetical protein